MCRQRRLTRPTIAALLLIIIISTALRVVDGLQRRKKPKEECGMEGMARSEMLAVHRDMRSQVASGRYRANGTLLGPAARMEWLEWDCGTARSAQYYADTCPQKESGATAEGENVYIYPVADGEHPENYTQVVGQLAANYWADEFQRNEVREINLGSGAHTDVYQLFHRATQMIWWWTKQIGCAHKICGRDIVVVCRYFPSGNYFQQQPYYMDCGRCRSGICAANYFSCFFGPNY